MEGYTRPRSVTLSRLWPSQCCTSFQSSVSGHCAVGGSRAVQGTPARRKPVSTEALWQGSQD